MAEIMTVCGPITPEELGFTSMHEHILLDSRVWCEETFDGRYKELMDTPIDIKNLHKIWKAPYFSRDNNILNDLNLACEELNSFKKAGGSTLIDLTLDGIGRNPSAIREISMRTGVQVIIGCGYYIQSSHPLHVARNSVEELADGMIHDMILLD